MPYYGPKLPPKPRPNKAHGKFIYMFSHMKTHQVIYSLYKNLLDEVVQRKLVKQLTFYGKKTVPSQLRPDLWRPFAVVTFPRADQGMQVYKYLKEYRVVRDHAWSVTPTEEDLALHEEEQERIALEAEEQEQKEGDEAEDAKKIKPVKHRYDTTMSHYSQNVNRRERARLLMDQRATSVADLSHIISRIFSPRTSHTYKERKAEHAKQDLWEKIVARANRNPAEIKALEDERSNLETAVKATTAQLKSGTARNIQAEKEKLKQRQRRITEITFELGTLRKAREAVAFVDGKEVSPEQTKKWTPAMKWIVQQRVPSRPLDPNFDAEKHAAERAEREQKAKRQMKLQSNAPKGATGYDVRKHLDVPLDGILIRWARQPDAQYAASWHESVHHAELEDYWSMRARHRMAQLWPETQEDYGYEEVPAMPTPPRDEGKSDLERGLEGSTLDVAPKEELVRVPPLAPKVEKSWMARMNPFGGRGGGSEARV